VRAHQAGRKRIVVSPTRKANKGKGGSITPVKGRFRGLFTKGFFWRTGNSPPSDYEQGGKRKFISSYIKNEEDVWFYKQDGEKVMTAADSFGSEKESRGGERGNYFL